jgi:hypothetical protein
MLWPDPAAKNGSFESEFNKYFEGGVREMASLNKRN